MMKWPLSLLLLGALTLGAQAQTGADDAAADSALKAERVEQRVEALDEPLYSPFVERYILDDLRQLRTELHNTRAELLEKVVDKELSVADKAMSYATDTVTYFFYLIAGASTVLVLIGWNSLRDIKARVQNIAEDQLHNLMTEYESRLASLETELQHKSRKISQNQDEIERTNEIHSLWLKASQEPNPQNKIIIYDQILRLRPDDVEAITYKADAVLMQGEPHWAISLCNQALDIDPNNAHAFYQRACALTGVGKFDEALRDLSRGVELSDAYREDAAVDEAFEPMRELEEFQALVQNQAEADTVSS